MPSRMPFGAAGRRSLLAPVQRFLAVEAAGGILLLVATVAALGWANSPWKAGYASLFAADITLGVGGYGLHGSLRQWIGDGLMAVFFFVVGLEIRRELVSGELRDRHAARLPAVAALGGMVAPALIYLAFNAGDAGERGWGIPMATDIAFAVGVVAVIGARVPASLKVFLLALAVIDDVGAIAVIAVAYTEDLSPVWLVAALGVVAVVIGLRRAVDMPAVLWVGLAVALWLCVYRSGVHATIAGVVMGLLTPDGPRRRSAVPLAERLESLLHPWTSAVVVPLFGLANAGIVLSGEGLHPTGAVTLGVVGGLVIGKVVGIAGATWLATRLGLGRLPPGVSWAQLIGIAAVAGIGFTVSLFVTGLAFEPGVLADDAKVGVLVASVLAAGIGSTLLVVAGRRAAGAGPASERPGAVP